MVRKEREREKERKKRDRVRRSRPARPTPRRLDGRAICTWNVEVSLIFMTEGVRSPIVRKPRIVQRLYIYFFFSFWYNNSTRGFSIIHSSRAGKRLDARLFLLLQSYTVFVQLDNPLKPLHYVILFFFFFSLSFFSFLFFLIHFYDWKWLLCVCALACAPPQRTQTQREAVYLFIPTNQVRINESHH